MNIEVGTKLVAFYGAMHPTVESTVVEIANGDVYHKCDPTDLEGTGYMTALEDIRKMGERSANGSPIGVFVAE